MSQWVIIVGEPSTGYQVFGLFPDHAAAWSYGQKLEAAEHDHDRIMAWCVVPLLTQYTRPRTQEKS